MWILISFAIIALVLFIIMTVLKIEPLISIVISVLSGLILAYFIERITITYTDDGKGNGLQIVKTNTPTTTTIPVIAPGTTAVHSSSNSASSNSASNAFGFFQSK
jgi:putative flippase GtrA